MVTCVVISLSLGWQKDHLSQQREGDLPPENKLILPYISPDEGCFVVISYCFNDFMSFPAKVYRKKMYLLLYLSFQIKV